LSICLIQCPYHAGDERLGSSKGPARLLEAGAADLAAAHGDVGIELIDRGGAFRDTATSSARVNERLAAVVRRTIDAGQLPVVLTGSCNSSLGVLAGFDHSRCGAVWIDAHADFNTPDTTASGFFPGMSLAIVTGHCYAHYWAQIGDNIPLAEEAIALFGVRDLSPEAERERLEASAIEVVAWRDGEPQRDVLPVLDELAQRTDDVYLHVDFDGFAPEVAPGVTDEPVPGGLSLEDGEAIIRATTERFRVRAATLATYNPELDIDDTTLQLGLRIIELLAGCAREQAS
jgi:arginase